MCIPQVNAQDYKKKTKKKHPNFRTIIQVTSCSTDVLVVYVALQKEIEATELAICLLM
jgi:aspartate-semialdehyde dehydrogenase